MTVDTVKVGPAGSEKEVDLYLAGRKCPKCGSALRMKWGNYSDTGAVIRMVCGACTTEFDYIFVAGPAWLERPDDSDPRFSASSGPSEIISEEAFREALGRRISRLKSMPPPPDSAAEEDLEVWEADVRIDARYGLGTLLELLKFSRADGRALEPEFAKLEPWLRRLIDHPRELPVNL